jgi:hypothetical protein
MGKRCFFYLAMVTFMGCLGGKQSQSSKEPKPIGDLSNAPSYGYTPVDPLPAYVDSVSYQNNKYISKYLLNFNGDDPLVGLFSDETIRIATASVSVNGNITFLTSSLGIKDSTYLIILDYIKYATQPLVASVGKDAQGNNIVRNAFLYGTNSNFFRDSTITGKAVIPLYVGFGLRITATLKVVSGQVNLGNLFGVGVSGSAGQVTGTLVVQTLGITGPDISALIPMPSDLNSTTIQNAILSLGSIKAKFYEHSTILSPRVVGFYNTIGGKNGSSVVNSVISNSFSRPIAVSNSYSGSDVGSDDTGTSAMVAEPGASTARDSTNKGNSNHKMPAPKKK